MSNSSSSSSSLCALCLFVTELLAKSYLIANQTIIYCSSFSLDGNNNIHHQHLQTRY